MADPPFAQVDHDPWASADREPFAPQQYGGLDPSQVALSPPSAAGTVGPNAARAVGRSVGGAAVAPLWNAGQYLGGLIHGNEEWQPSRAVELGGELALSLMPMERGAVAVGNLARRVEQTLPAVVAGSRSATPITQLERAAAPSLEQQPFLHPNDIADKHLIAAEGNAPRAEQSYLRTIADTRHGRPDPQVIDAIYEGYKGPEPESFLPEVDYASTAGEHTTDQGGLSPENAAFLKAYTGLDQNNFSGRVYQNGPTKGISGFYLDKDPKTGETVPSSIGRQIYQHLNAADHSMLELSPSLQGQGIAKDLLANHVDWYRQNDIREVGVHAGLDNGAYTWPKFGFVPDQGSWDALRKQIRNLSYFDPARPWPSDVRERIIGALDNPNPKAIWAIAYDKTPVTFGGKSTTLGKALLGDRSWTGKLDLTDSEAMKRFDAYVANRPGKIKPQ